MSDLDKGQDLRGISWAQIEKMTVDSKGRLHWDGDLVQVQKRLTLTPWQALGAFLVAAGGLGAAVQGGLAGVDLACRFGWLVTWCKP